MDLKTSTHCWPIKGTFAISRGSKTTADVVMVELYEDGHVGRGECVPYARYGESLESVCDLIEGLRGDIKNGLDRHALQSALPAGAARNALDCAYWDLEAKKHAKRAWQLADIETLAPLTTAYTLSLDTPENMGSHAVSVAHMPVLKLKLAGAGDLDRVAAVRKGSPNAKIIVDANEGWSVDLYHEMAPHLVDLGVAMIEQPLPASDDDALIGIKRPVPLCADESVHGLASLDKIIGKYDLINIKLDKTGGLTEALQLKQAAEDAGLGIMVGCMLATSLAMAPAMIVAQDVSVVDLDGPLLLAEDHSPAIKFENGVMSAPAPELWG